MYVIKQSKTVKSIMNNLKNSLFLFLIFVTGYILVYSCAVEAAPLGGPKDNTGPVPIPEKSTPNEQIFFKKQDITLAFNEWVVLKNPNAIIISPPLDNKLEAKLKKKNLVLSFDEQDTLRENTTYTINIGSAIVDYTEGNPMENYTFVFSTGSYIDSLSVQGVVIDDFTKEPVEEVIVSMYDNLQDSAIYKERPMYFTRTDKNGKFKINNIKQDSFRIFALDDKNLNYFKDQENEGMAFYPDTIILDTSFQENIKLGFFVPAPSLRITSKDQEYSLLKLTLNKAVDSLDYILSRQPEFLESFIKKDTAYLWYQNKDSTDIYIDLGNDKIDTIALIVETDSIKYNNKIRIQNAIATTKSTLAPSDTFRFTLNRYITSFDPSKIQLIDSSDLPKEYYIELNKKDKRSFLIKRKWLEGQKYNLVLLEGAFTDFLGNSSDSLNVSFITGNTSSLGEIIFELDSLNASYDYIIELSKGNDVYSKTVNNQDSTTVVFNALKTGKYKSRIIEDRNNNGRWDPGNYNDKIPSERWISAPLESLKAGWTLEVSVNGRKFEK